MRKLTAEPQALGTLVGHRVVNELLHQLGYTLQANRKTTDGTEHPDPDARFNVSQRARTQRSANSGSRSLQ